MPTPPRTASVRTSRRRCARTFPITASRRDIGLQPLLLRRGTLRRDHDRARQQKLDDLLWYVMPNLVRLAHGICDEDLARAKLSSKVSICSTCDGDIVSGETMASHIQTMGRVMSLAEALARVDAVTMADIKTKAE